MKKVNIVFNTIVGYLLFFIGFQIFVGGMESSSKNIIESCASEGKFIFHSEVYYCSFDQ